MNNPPAFPHTVEYKGSDCGGIVPHSGMTLRDYFAAKAMQALLSDNDWRQDMDFDDTAFAANKQADAMMKARS
jgi:hypothetical protein